VVRIVHVNIVPEWGNIDHSYHFAHLWEENQQVPSLYWELNECICQSNPRNFQKLRNYAQKRGIVLFCSCTMCIVNNCKIN
jgi:hypothetical protein